MTLRTLTKYPPVNIDEVGVSTASDHYIKTGEIRNTLEQGVVSPQFEDLVSAGQDGFRGVHYGILGLYQKIAGKTFLSNRMFSVLIWILTGGLLFFIINGNLGTAPASMTALLWFTSFDVTLAAHLIRPDILLSFFLVLILFLFHQQSKKFSKPTAVFLGLIAILAIGVHPHGLSFVGLAIFGTYLLRKSNLLPLRERYIWIFLGFLMGGVVLLYLSDVPTEIMSMRTVGLLIISRTASLNWHERLWPPLAIADAALLVLNPSTFYLPSTIFTSVLSGLTGFFRFFSILLTVVWSFSISNRFSYKNFLAALSGYFFLAVGFGHIRNELIYNVPLLITIYPLMALIVLESARTIQKDAVDLTSFRSKKYFLSVCICVGIAALGLFWCARYNIVLYLLIALLLFHWEGHNDRSFLWMAATGLFLALCLFIRDLNGIKQGNLFIFSLLNRPVDVGVLLVAVSSGAVAIILKKKERFPSFKKSYIACVKLSFLLGCIVLGTSINFRLQINALRRNPSLEETFKETQRIIELKPIRILGPSFFWFSYFNSFRWLGACTDDYYYSLRKNPKASIDRYKPEVLIIDQDFIRLFLVAHEKGTKKYSIIPLQSIISVPFQLLGTIPGNFHHSNLFIYRLFWEKTSMTKK